MSNQIKTRFAPSPTGYLHVGGLRTALYAYLVARKNNGKFVLRIEDTDQSRYVEGAVEKLISTLKNVGIDYDEGPTFENNEVVEKGDFGPYTQSKRFDLYKKYAQELINNDLAYYCFCTSEELDEMRTRQEKRGEAPMYNEQCRKLTQEEIDKNLADGKPYVVRLKIPEEGELKFDDKVRGEVKFNYGNIDDQVLLKSDGFPTYHLANVVDDHLMGINLVIRGEEWLPSTPKHIFLYECFGWDIPRFAHIPLILNPDKSKLSKRQGDVAVEDYLTKGYLPEALLNFIAFLGWNPGDERELFSLKELIEEFSLERVRKSGSIFDTKKLDWLNGQYIRKMDLEKLTQLCLPYLKQKNITKDHNLAKKIVWLEQERLTRLDEVGDKTQFLLADKLDYSPELLIWKKSGKDDAIEKLILAKNILQKNKANDNSLENITQALLPVAKEVGVGNFMWPLRIALTGQEASPGPFEVASVLGVEKTLERIEKAIDLLS